MSRLSTSLPSRLGYTVGILVIVIGALGVLAIQLAAKTVPDSFFGAATYLGITGVAVIARTHSATAQNHSSETFIARAAAGVLVVVLAVRIEIFQGSPDAASWTVYLVAVATEAGLFWVDAKYPPSTNGSGSNKARWVSVAIAVAVPIAIAVAVAIVIARPVQT